MRELHRIACVLVVALGLAPLLACATETEIRWEKPGGTQEELEAAQADCRAGQEAHRNQRGATRGVEPGVRKYYYNQCMNEHGWVSVQEQVERKESAP